MQAAHGEVLGLTEQREQLEPPELASKARLVSKERPAQREQTVQAVPLAQAGNKAFRE